MSASKSRLTECIKITSKCLLSFTCENKTDPVYQDHFKMFIKIYI